MLKELCDFIQRQTVNSFEDKFVFERIYGELIELRFEPLTDELRRIKGPGNNGVLRFIPASYTMAGLSLNEMRETLFDFKSLLSKLFKNLLKANNSFEGVERERVVLQVLVVKYGADSILMAPELFDSFITSIKEEIIQNTVEFQKHSLNFDRSYLCVSVDELLKENNSLVLDISQYLKLKDRLPITP